MRNKIILSNEWKPKDDLTLEDNAFASVRENRNVLIIAGPGAGKTELLAQKACYLLQTDECTSPQKILAISFKTDSADNLKKRVVERCGDTAKSRFASMTYDAFAKRLLDRFINSLPEQYRPDKEYLLNDKQCIQTAFFEAGFVNASGLSASKLDMLLDNQLASVTLPISMSNLGIKERAWFALIKGTGKIKPCLSYKMVSCLTEFILRTNKYLRRALLLTYTHVFLDEFQDTTDIQYNLVKTCFMNSNSVLTAVGDNKQSIMRWAGALKTAFEDYCKDFSAVENSLLMNHRSAPRLVELQKMMYALLKDEPKNVICSPKWNKDDGIIRLYKFANADQEAEIIANNIISVSDAGTALEDICILSKQLPEEYTYLIINKLAERGIKARIETEYQDLLKEPLTTLIINTFNLILPKRDPESWEEVMLFLNSIYSQQMDIPDFVLNKQESLYAFLQRCSTDLLACFDIKIFKKIIESIVDFYEVDNIKSVFPVYSQGDHFKLTLQKIIDFFWEEFMLANYNLEQGIKNLQGFNSIPIMTIHKSKGLEYGVVYFIGLEDGAFWNFSNQPMEDRCAFFVALSRAKREINFTFSENRKVRFREKQSHYKINEFYGLLEASCLVEVLDKTSETNRTEN